MDNIAKQLDNLSEIKNLMEKSSRFISLSGLSGVFAGIFALIGAALIYFKYSIHFYSRYTLNGVFDYDKMLSGNSLREFVIYSITVGAIIFILAISSGIFFTARKAKRNNISAWDNTTKRLLANLFLPIIAGGIFIIALVFHKIIFLVAPVTLIFYGLGLINASKYTYHDVKYLGIIEIALGLIATFFVGYGLIFWTIGFGVMHIIYGAVMYFKYERK